MLCPIPDNALILFSFGFAGIMGAVEEGRGREAENKLLHRLRPGLDGSGRLRDYAATAGYGSMERALLFLATEAFTFVRAEETRMIDLDITSIGSPGLQASRFALDATVFLALHAYVYPYAKGKRVFLAVAFAILGAVWLVHWYLVSPNTAPTLLSTGGGGTVTVLLFWIIFQSVLAAQRYVFGQVPPWKRFAGSSFLSVLRGISLWVVAVVAAACAVALTAAYFMATELFIITYVTAESLGRIPIIIPTCAYALLLLYVGRILFHVTTARETTEPTGGPNEPAPPRG